MFGQNIKRKPVFSNGNKLDVQEIFPTLQGEGPFVGRPSIFLRLGGCNLACNFCDTEFESFKEMSIERIMLEIKNLSKNKNGKISHKLVVITGGEPFRQPIEQIVEKCLESGYDVQIETNGTIFREINPKASIICSPKTTNGKYAALHPELLPRITALKFILSKNQADYKTVAEIGQTQNQIPVYVQPMDEYDETKNQENIEYAREYAENHGYYLSLQTHKILNIK